MSHLIPLLTLLTLITLISANQSPLDKLRAFGRQCFPFPDVVPCVMYMNHNAQFGCGQCDAKVRSEPLVEFTTTASLIQFSKPTSGRRTGIIIVPEFVFFEKSVVAALVEAKNVAAAIVYEGNSPGRASIVGRSIDYFPPIDRGTSDDDTEPNRFHNLYNQVDTNEFCLELGRRNIKNAVGTCRNYNFFPFNIFRVTAKVADEIRQKANRFPDLFEPADGTTKVANFLAPRYKLESVGRMFACAQQSVVQSEPNDDGEVENLLIPANSRDCLGNSTCHPIGSHSIWSALGRMDPKTNVTDRNILAITAPMDSVAFFEHFALGASAEITSLAIMMAIAEAVGKYYRGPGKDKTLLMQPVFFAFNAESWGYAGSGRFLNDLKDFKCEVEPELLDPTGLPQFGCSEPYMPSVKFLEMRDSKFSVINIGQMLEVNDTLLDRVDRNFSIHGRNAETEQSPQEMALTEAFKTYATNLKLALAEKNRISKNLAPDASQSFRQIWKESSVVTVAGYSDSFTNKFYHTMYDNEIAVEEVLKQPMYEAASAIASAIVKLVYDVDTKIEVNRTQIDAIVTCLTHNFTKCTALGTEYLGKDVQLLAKDYALPGNYAGSFFPYTRQADKGRGAFPKLLFVRNFLAYHTRYETSQGRVECSIQNNVKDPFNFPSYAGCAGFVQKLNPEGEVKQQSDLQQAYCVKGICVAADTHTHNAYGGDLTATNTQQSTFNYSGAEINATYDATNPRQGGWTESAWDRDLGLCAFNKDTSFYGALILLAGILLVVVNIVLGIWLDRVLSRIPDDEDRNEEKGSFEQPVLDP